MFLSLDGTFWIQLINFAIFFAILNVIFLRPVGEALKKRRQYIDSVQGDYDRYTHQVETLGSEAEQKRAAARRSAEETVAKERAAAERDADAIVAEATARAEAIADEARRTVAGEIASARSREDELSQALAKTLLDRAIGATS